jgi:cytochrome c
MRRVAIVSLLLALAACGPSAPTPASPASAPAATFDLAAMQARIAALEAPYNEGDFEAGRRAFAQCRSCHTVVEGGGNRVGPNLYGVFGREIGAAKGFAYSQPVQDADFIWDGERLDHWLENPRPFLPGNRMAFAGVRDETQRRDLIAYLMVTSTSE